MFGLSMGEIMVIMIVALVFLGPKKLPEIAKGLGKGIRDFQKALRDESDDSKVESPKTQVAQESTTENSQKILDKTPS